MENTLESAKAYIAQLDKVDPNWNSSKSTIASALISYSEKTNNAYKRGNNTIVENNIGASDDNGFPKIQKLWRLRLQINKDRVATRIFTNEPTEEDVCNFVYGLEIIRAEVNMDIIWRLS